MNWGPLSFPGEAKTNLLIAGTMALAAVLLILAFRREDKRRLISRLIITMLAAISLLMLALQPRWRSKHFTSPALLITAGATPNQLKELLKSYSFVDAFSLDGVRPWQSILPNVKAIPDIAYLKRHYPETRALHVIGHGLDDYDWPELDSVQILPHLTPLPNGIKHILGSRQVGLGQPLQLQGAMSIEDEKTFWLYLLDFTGAVDSVKLEKKNEWQFQLRSIPREVGRYLYTLQLKTPTGQQISQEAVDVSVTPPRRFAVLVLESAPRFETKYLKNWLGTQQNAVAVRLAISKERYRSEFINLLSFDLSKIDAGLLKHFDLVVIDGRSLQEMTASERQALRSQIEKEGLGVLLVPDQIVWGNDRPSFSGQPFFVPFQWGKFTDLEERLVKPNWDGSPFQITEIPAAPFEIKSTWGVRPLVKDGMERLLAAAVQRGAGRVGVSLIENTYRWILEGNSNYHAAYWSHLLSNLSRPETHERWTLYSSGPVIIHRPLHLHLATSAQAPFGEVISAARKDTIYLQQEMDSPELWDGLYWPRESGWHQVATPNGEPYWFYVHEKTSWQTWQKAQRRAATERYAALASSTVKRNQDRYQYQSRPIPLLWFYLGFLLSITFLWLERKL